MESFETTTTVAAEGEIHLAGLPFLPGTEVHVVVHPQPVASTSEPQLATAKAEMAELFRTIKGFRLGERLSREELLERGRLN